MSHVLVQQFYLRMELVHRLKISQDFLKRGLGQLSSSPKSTTGKQTNYNKDTNRCDQQCHYCLLEYYP